MNLLMPTLAELKQRGDAAIAAKKAAIAEARRIAIDAQKMQAETRLALAQYQQMRGRGIRVVDLTQVKRWHESRQHWEAEWLLLLGTLHH